MTLSPSSVLVIDLLLLTDAVAGGDVAGARSLARRISRTATESHMGAIADLAMHVEELASRPAPAAVIAYATQQLLTESEREILSSD